MPYKTEDIPETVSILGIAFVVGVVAQYLRQKTDETVSNANLVWLSLASGFSAMVAIGLLYEYTDISGAFLIAVSGLAGWAGISILSTLSTSFDQLLIKSTEKKLGIQLDKQPQTPIPEEVKQNDLSITTMDSQTE